ncbi:hypothetical protein BKA57DRAFT_446896 [Linnemannia elongata]|nr:hypothetical protein BKA57DRAFT_446896 [Linnemannia elongata]
MMKKSVDRVGAGVGFLKKGLVNIVTDQKPSTSEGDGLLGHGQRGSTPVSSGKKSTIYENEGSFVRIQKGSKTMPYDSTIVPATAVASTITTTATATAIVTTDITPLHSYAHTKDLPGNPKKNLQRSLSDNVVDNSSHPEYSRVVNDMNDWVRARSEFYNNPEPSVVNLAIVGNPGVGKSAILNALGGHFDSGYSEVSGRTTDVSDKLVPINHFQLRLFDIPGIDDCSPDGRDSIVKHLKMLEEALSQEGPFVILFVIKPTNGRIKPGDYVIMKTVLESLKEGPQMGLILTQARPTDMHQYRSPTYTRMVLGPLEKIVDKRSKKFLSKVPPLVLADHDERGFSADERIDILNFVLSFDPKPVDSRNMVEQVVRQFFDAVIMSI